MTAATSASRRGRAAHLGPERRRPQVLDAALRIAASEGMVAVTIGAVAARLGVTRPVVYSCFPGRVELIEALLQREEELLREGLLSALHTARGDDPEAAFISGYQAMLQVVTQRPDTWRMLFGANADPAVADLITAVRATVTDGATRWIGPALQRWWQPADLDRKLPVLIDLFMSSCQSAARSLLDSENDWTAVDLGEFYGRAMCRAFQSA